VLEGFERFYQGVSKIYQEQCCQDGHIQGCPFGNLALELASQDEVVGEKLRDIFGSMIDYVDTLLQRGVAEGELPDIDTRMAARGFVALFEGATLLTKTYNVDMVTELVQGVIQLASLSRLRAA
jgi:TetR/AcrR family transcriptional repressor of nem operon